MNLKGFAMFCPGSDKLSILKSILHRINRMIWTLDSSCKLSYAGVEMDGGW